VARDEMAAGGVRIGENEETARRAAKMSDKNIR